MKIVPKRSIQELLTSSRHVKSPGKLRSSVEETAKVLGITEEELREELKTIRQKIVDGEIELPDKTSGAFPLDTETPDDATLLRRHNYDPTQFRLVRVWRKTKGSFADESIFVAPIGSTKTVLELYLEQLEKAPSLPAPKKKNIKKEDAGDLYHIFCTFDIHLGKLRYKSSENAREQLLVDINVCANEILEHMNLYKGQEIIIPIGNDLLNADDSRLSTTRGTPLETEAEIENVFFDALSFYTDLIVKCAQLAPVLRIVLVAGNHARYSETILAVSLSHYFRHWENVVFEIDKIDRKALVLGRNLIVLSHGELPAKRYAEIVPHEFKEEFGKTDFTEVLLGHTHRFSETKPVFIADTLGGVLVRHLSAMSHTDKWHFDNGFNVSIRRSYCLTYKGSGGIKMIFHSTPPDK
jgi:hypothetical protein